MPKMKTAAEKAAKRAVSRNTKESRLGKSAAQSRSRTKKKPSNKRVRIAGGAPRRK